MNAMHYGKLGSEKDGRRGKVRDALTLLDESGVIVAGSNPDVLRSLVKRDWPSAFITHRPAWREEMKVLVCGHAILEKFLDPYKSLTAHALVLYAPGYPSAETLDGLLSEKLGRDGMLRSSADLSPLPLMGIPGWWAGSPQDQSFYRDSRVNPAWPSEAVLTSYPCRVSMADSIWRILSSSSMTSTVFV